MSGEHVGGWQMLDSIIMCCSHLEQKRMLKFDWKSIGFSKCFPKSTNSNFEHKRSEVVYLNEKFDSQGQKVTGCN